MTTLTIPQAAIDAAHLAIMNEELPEDKKHKSYQDATNMDGLDNLEKHRLTNAIKAFLVEIKEALQAAAPHIIEANKPRYHITEQFHPDIFTLYALESEEIVLLKRFKTLAEAEAKIKELENENA